MPTEDAEIVLEIVADFFALPAFKHRAKFLQNGQHLGPLLKQRHVVTRARCPRKGQANQVALPDVEAVSLAVKAKRGLLQQRRDQRLSLVGRIGELVVVLHILHPFERTVGRFLFNAKFVAEQPPTQRIEFQFSEESLQLLTVPFSLNQIHQSHVQRHVALNGDQLLGKQSLFPMFFYVLLLLALELVGVRQQLFDAAVLSDELLRRLGADPRYAGHIVRGVAHQPQHIYHLVNPLDLPLCENFRYAQHLGLVAAAPRLVHKTPLGNELAVVLVGRDHVRRKSLILGLLGQRADYIVGLPPRLAQNRDIKRLAEPEHVRQCLAQILGHGLALGFVLFVLVVPVRRLRRVKDDGDMRRLALFDDGEQGVGKGKNGRRIHAL